MFILDEFLNISKDIMEFVGWLEVCIFIYFLNIFNLCLVIVFYWIVFVILLYCISIISCEDVGLLNC